MMVTREFVLPNDHPVLPGHFLGHPVVPGVVLLSWCELLAEELAGTPIAASKWVNVKFVQLLRPAQTCRITLTCDAPGTAKFLIKCGEQLIANGQLEWPLRPLRMP